MTRRILIVEDNADDAELSVAALRQHQAHVEITVVEDGVEAIEYLRACNGGTGAKPLPDVVLLDLKLPRMDGHEVLAAIRSDPPMKHLPVVILTSSIEDQDLTASYELGANSYVRKPINFDEFSKVAERLGEYWLALNRVSPSIGRGER